MSNKSGEVTHHTWPGRIRIRITNPISMEVYKRLCSGVGTNTHTHHPQNGGRYKHITKKQATPQATNPSSPPRPALKVTARAPSVHHQDNTSHHITLHDKTITQTKSTGNIHNNIIQQKSKLTHRSFIPFNSIHSLLIIVIVASISQGCSSVSV